MKCCAQCFVNEQVIRNILASEVCVKTENELMEIQKHFHRLINERAEKMVKENNVILPVIDEKCINVKQWIPIPGMYGGFSYILKNESGVYNLYVESWCRIAEGSGQAHTINKNGYVLTEEGF